MTQKKPSPTKSSMAHGASVQAKLKSNSEGPQESTWKMSKFTKVGPKVESKVGQKVETKAGPKSATMAEPKS